MTESVTLTEELPLEEEHGPWTEKTFMVEDRFPFVETRDQSLRCHLAPLFQPDIETPMMIGKLEALFQWIKHGAPLPDARQPSPIRRV